MESTHIKLTQDQENAAKELMAHQDNAVHRSNYDLIWIDPKIFNNEQNGENKVYCKVLTQMGYKSLQLYDDLKILKTTIQAKSKNKASEYEGAPPEKKEKYYFLIITSGKFAKDLIQMVKSDENLKDVTKIFVFTRDYNRSKEFIENDPEIVSGIVENFHSLSTGINQELSKI